MQEPIHIMTGAIFEDGYLEGCHELNKKYDKVKIHELYSSLRSSYSGIPTARPDFRLKETTWEELEAYIKKAHELGMIFNYTMNASDVGDLEHFSKNYSKIAESVKRLERIGVDRVTIASPLLLDLVCQETKLPIEVSTIMHVDSLQTPHVLKELYPNINKICLGVSKNREIGFVRKITEVCKSLGIELEVMVNEFCMIENAPCQNIHRPHCYKLHSANQTENVARKGINSDGSKQPSRVSGYPWSSGTSGCVYSRNIDKTAWLNSRTVWPNESLEYANITGVRNYKVTCRTAPKDWGLQLNELYMRGEYNGPLAGLWLQLQASLLSAREKFDNIQNKMVSTIPYNAEILSRPHRMKMRMTDGTWYEGDLKFYDRFFLDPAYSPDDYVSVDKEDDELKEWECNWVYKWNKIVA